MYRVNVNSLKLVSAPRLDSGPTNLPCIHAWLFSVPLFEDHLGLDLTTLPCNRLIGQVPPVSGWQLNYRTARAQFHLGHNYLTCMAAELELCTSAFAEAGFGMGHCQTSAS